VSTRPSTSHAVHADALHRAHAHSIFSYCVWRLRSREEAEDAVQIVFLNAQRSLERGIEPEFQRAWLLKIAERVVSNLQRASRRRARVEFPVDPEGFAGLVAHTHSTATSAPLMEALSRISEKQRRVLLLCEVHGLSHAEASAELGISRNAVAALLARARRSLVAELSRSGTGPRVRISSLLSVAFDLRWLVGGVGGKIAAGGASLAVVALVSHPGHMLARVIAPGTAHAASSAVTWPQPAGLRGGPRGLRHELASTHVVRQPSWSPPPLTAVPSAAEAAPGPGPATVDTLAPPDEAAQPPVEPAQPPVEPPAASSPSEPEPDVAVSQTGGPPASEEGPDASGEAGTEEGRGPTANDAGHPSPPPPERQAAATCPELPCAADHGAPSDLPRPAQGDRALQAAPGVPSPVPPSPPAAH
jgi:RNA polymerase sigma factor (sigma-70 family)